MAPASRSFMRRGVAATALLAAQQLPAASAALATSEDVELEVLPDVKKLFGSSDNAICGGTDIRRFLSAPTSSDEVRNIPWSQVYAIADEYIKTQGSEVQRLTSEIERLRTEIPLREKQEAPQPISADQVTSLLTQALSSTGSYGSVDVAKNSKCGAALVRPRPSREAFKTAAEAFSKAVRELLSGGRASAQGLAVRSSCETLLGASASDGSSNCPELCQQFADAAQRTSDEFAGARAINGKSSDQLRRELDDATSLLKAAVAQLEGCKQTKTDLDVFKAQLQTLQGDISTTHETLRGARDALMDAEYDLEDAQQSVQTQEAEAKKAQELLQNAGALAQTAVSKFQTAQQQASGAQKVVQAATTEVTGARTTLKSTQEAADALNRLKASVSDSMLRMVMYFDEAVRGPVRVMGLGENVSVNNLFPSQLPALASAKACRTSVEALNTFCNQADTRQALAAAMTDKADTRELCLIGDVPEIERSIDDAVAQTVEAVKNALREVQSWLDPYKGQEKVTKDSVAASVEQGVPVGLHEVISIFSGTAYYREYLRHWQLKGKFLELYRALFESLRQAEAAHGQAVTKLEGAKTQLQQSLKAQEDAKAAMEAAVAAQQVSQGKQAEAQKLLEQLTASAQQAKRRLDELEKAVADATKRWQSAKTVLEQTHKQGVSLVEILEALEA